jgi:hypothetical protein
VVDYEIVVAQRAPRLPGREEASMLKAVRSEVVPIQQPPLEREAVVIGARASSNKSVVPLAIILTVDK